MVEKNETFELAEKIVDAIFKKEGEGAGEINIKRVTDLFMFIALLGCNRLNILREEMRQCQKIG